jgi:hypothetical protein
LLLLNILNVKDNPILPQETIAVGKVEVPDE